MAVPRKAAYSWWMVPMLLLRRCIGLERSDYFDRPLIANPDLPARIASNWPLTPVDPTATGEDCTHYPTCRSQATNAAAPPKQGRCSRFSH